MLRQFAGMKAPGGRAQALRAQGHAWAILVASVVLAAGSTSAIAQAETETPETGGDATEAAEALYVIEHLVVSVNSAADGSGERVGQIQSGDKVDVLERQGDQARVRLASGNEGWVRASYLSQSPPMREQLKARTAELDKLRQEKSKLETDLQTARKAASEAAARAATARGAGEAAAKPSSATAAVEPSPQSARPESTADSATTTGSPASTASSSTESPSASTPPPLFASEGMMPRRPSWIFALLTSAAALGIGFALGWRMLDRRIRAKYGGLRIY